MFVGTGSDVGKSVINAAFCRIFVQDGFAPAPFKAQNMSLNSFATPDGLEIGRAQAVQAEACKIPCSVEMNPILLKPTSYKTAQVVLNGKPFKNQSAAEYFLGTDRDQLFAEVMKSFHHLNANFSPVVVEGAGSISELNLWDKDITNMRVAVAADAATILITDIDKGGIFGSVYGTMELLPEKERKQIKGILINKFRGDIKLFDTGREKLEELTGVPVVGIIPWFTDIHIEQEDSVVLDNKSNQAVSGKINVAVMLLRHMSNFTDFDVFDRIPSVQLFYTANELELANADIIIIPGSKNTISDMLQLRNSGLASTIVQLHEKGTPVYGICGGFQMMGKEINDPFHVEGDIESMPGLGILPIVSTIAEEKKTEQVNFSFLGGENNCRGYEIHMGTSTGEDIQALCTLENGDADGCYVNPKTWGTYIHGIFDNAQAVNHILSQVDGEARLNFNYAAYKNSQFDKLADHVRANVDMKYIYEVLKGTF